MTEENITIPVPGNGWRTPEWIMEAYNLSSGKFYRLRDECLSSKYSDAIVTVNQKTSFIREDLWQNFLEFKSAKHKADRYGIQDKLKNFIV